MDEDKDLRDWIERKDENLIRQKLNFNRRFQYRALIKRKI